MAPRVRIYGKKRGNRYTGDSRAGSWGFALFCLSFLVVGCIGFGFIFFALTLPEWQVYNDYRSHTCVVRDKRIGEKKGDDSPSYRPEILIEYSIGGKTYRDWTYDITGVYSSDRGDSEAILDQFEIGRQYSCWYNPHDVRQAVLVRRFTWFAWLMPIVPLTFIVFGLGGLIYTIVTWGKSAERRAVESQRGSALDLLDDERRVVRRFPTVPDDAMFTNSAGTTLDYRLPSASSAGLNLAFLGIFGLIWNGIVSIFVTMAVRSHLNGDPEWFLTIFIIPFVLVGLLIVYAFVRELLVSTGVGSTIVEISDYPLYPGGEYDLFVSQAGRLHMNELAIVLVCEETATYRQGTDTRTRTMRVFEQTIASREAFDIHADVPLEMQFTLRVPDGAMHSFASANNRISWKLLVRGGVAGWPDFERGFALNVYPAVEYASGA